jgi:predicted amidohydrolase
MLREYAEPVDGAHISALRAAAAAAGVYVVAGYDRLDVDGLRVHNSAELIGPDGATVGIYNKVHCPDANDLAPETHRGWYTPGDALPVFETRFGKVGILICMDRVFPEAVRPARP